MDAAALSDTPGIRIEPIAAVHIDSFHHALDVVAREKKYLPMLEATPLPQTREFVMGMIAKGNPQFVATAEGEVVGWCDISRHFFPSHAHRGRLGMGILPAYRGKGLGRRLIETTLRAAQNSGFARVELDVYEDNARAIALSTKRRDLPTKVSSGVRRASMAGSSMRSAWRFCSMSAASHRSWYRRRFLERLQQADRAEAAVALGSRRLRMQFCLITPVQPNFLVQSVCALCIQTINPYPRSMILSRCATAAAAPRLGTESLLKMLDT